MKKILDSNSIIYNNKDASLYWSELLISIFNEESKLWKENIKKNNDLKKNKGGT